MVLNRKNTSKKNKKFYKTMMKIVIKAIFLNQMLDILNIYMIYIVIFIRKDENQKMQQICMQSVS